MAPAVLLAGCGGAGVTIPPGAEELEPCPPRVITVEDLADVAAGECDFAGSSVQLPDGTLLSVSEVGAVSSTQYGEDVPEHTVVNWGVPGVGVSSRGTDAVDIWASTAEAERLQRKQLALAGG